MHTESNERHTCCSGVLCLSDATRPTAPPSDPLLPPSSLPFPAPPRAPLPPARWLAACCKDCADLETAPSTPRLAAPSPTRGARLPREADASPPPPVERLRFGAINAFPLPTSDLVCDLKKSNQVPGSCKGLCCTMVQIRFGFGFHTVIWVQTVWNYSAPSRICFAPSRICFNEIGTDLHVLNGCRYQNMNRLTRWCHFPLFFFLVTPFFCVKPRCLGMIK